MTPTLYYNLKVPRSKKKRIWKKWKLNKNGKYTVSAMVKKGNKCYRMSYTLILRSLAKNRRIQIPVPYCDSQTVLVDNVKCAPIKEGRK